MALKSKFCAKCGLEKDRLVGNLCSECFFDLHEIKIPKTTEFALCSKCGSIRVEHFWVAVEKQNRDVFSDQVKKAIKVPDEIKVIKVDLIKIKPDGLIEVTYDLQGTIISKEYRCALRVNKQVCPPCKIEARTDYKAKLQLRTKEDPQKFLKDCYDFLSAYKKRLLKIEEFKMGVDAHLRSRKDALELAQDFKQKHKFECHMRETREEYSWDRKKNKPKYKSTILLTKK